MPIDFEKVKNRCERLWSELLDLENDLSPFIYGSIEDKDSNVERYIDVAVNNIGDLFHRLEVLEEKYIQKRSEEDGE